MTCKYCGSKMTDNTYPNFDGSKSLFYRCDNCAAVYYKRGSEVWYTAKEYEEHVKKSGLQ